MRTQWTHTHTHTELVKVINEFCEIQYTKFGCISVSNNEQLEMKLGKQLHLQYHQKALKYLGVNLTKAAYSIH